MLAVAVGWWSSKEGGVSLTVCGDVSIALYEGGRERGARSVLSAESVMFVPVWSMGASWTRSCCFYATRARSNPTASSCTAIASSLD